MCFGAFLATTQTLIAHAYSAFNDRDINAALALMTENVSWPKASEGGSVVGKEQIRAYWMRQWKEFDPHVEPIEVIDREDGKTEVRVHQLVKSPGGAFFRPARYGTCTPSSTVSSNASNLKRRKESRARLHLRHLPSTEREGETILRIYGNVCEKGRCGLSSAALLGVTLMNSENILLRPPSRRAALRLLTTLGSGAALPRALRADRVAEPEAEEQYITRDTAMNSRNIETLLALVTENVDWPNGSTRLHGKGELRSYELGQWEETRTHDEPIHIAELAPDKYVVRINQVVRTLNGSIISTGEFDHIHHVRNRLIGRLDIKRVPPSASDTRS
jgi:nuclear transport factor 2 (NTF2) superfamily protein